ncbi:MAG: alpha/beta hydrolase family protein [Archangium sp.]
MKLKFLLVLVLASCTHRSAGEDSPQPPERSDTRRIASPPSYSGTVDNKAPCNRVYETAGYEPTDGVKHPLFLYFVGTKFGDGDATNIDQPAPMWVADAAAQQGFVALSVGYDNGGAAWLSDHTNQLACMFEAAREESLIAKACAMPNVDCELGIVTWGHSQGGYVAAMAHDLEPRVKAAWTVGYGGDGKPTLDKDRVRIVNGEADGKNGKAETLNTFFGTRCTGVDTCVVGENGGGWRIVRKSELVTVDGIAPSADHCWFDRRACTDLRVLLEPAWTAGEADFSIVKSVAWLKARL